MQYSKQIVFFLFLSFVFCFPAYGAEDFTLNRVVAVVNGDVITLHDVRGRLAAEIARVQPSNPQAYMEERLHSTLDTMINDILLLQEAKKISISVSEGEVDSEVKRVVQQSKLSPQAFEATLLRQGSSLNAFKDIIRNNLIRQRFITTKVSRRVFVKQSDVEQYYQTHKSEFVSQPRVDFSLIAFSPATNAPAVYADIKSGKLSFEEAVARFSVDASSQQGGKVTQVPWASMPPHMQDLFSQLSEGEMSSLIKTETTFVLIRLDALYPGGEQLGFNDVSSKIEARLRESLYDELYAKLIQQIRARAVIDYRL